MPRTTDNYAILLEVSAKQPLPSCFEIAHHNTQRLQEKSGYFRAIQSFQEFKKEGGEKKLQMKPSKVSFKEDEVKVFIYNTKGAPEAVSFEKNIPMRIQPRIIPTAKFIVRCVWTCLVGAKPWKKTVWGQHHNVAFNLSLFQSHLTIDILRSDLRKIYAAFRQFRSAVINYKQSLRLPYQYPEKTFDRHTRKWNSTGKTIQVATKLRLYLIKVIKDSELAAISIQTAWRRKKAYKIFHQMKVEK